MAYPRRASASPSGTEKGYSWLFFSVSRSWVLGCLFTLLVVGASGIFYVWYSHNGDNLTPTGNIGLSYGIAGFSFLLLAAIWYSVLRRLGEPALGQLNRTLTWHGFFALTGLALLFMHSFGEFGVDSGTCALASMVLLVLSGLVGRVLDRVLAWQAAVSASVALTVEGEDRVETITQEVQTLVAWQAWGAAAISPARVQWEMAELQEVQQAMQRERFCRLVIRAWRQVHIALALLTLVLTVWHIAYEMPYLVRAFFS